VRWTGPASLAHCRWFSAFSAANAKNATSELGLVDVGGGLLMLAPQVEEFQAYEVPARPRYHLLAGIDSVILLRRDLPSLLDAGDLDRVIPGGRPGERLGTVSDLPDHMIVD